MNSPLAENARVDRKAFSISDLHEDSGALEYWLQQSPLKRLEGLELLRQIAHSYDPDTARLPRVLTIVERSRNYPA